MGKVFRLAIPCSYPSTTSGIHHREICRVRSACDSARSESCCGPGKESSGSLNLHDTKFSHLRLRVRCCHSQLIPGGTRFRTRLLGLGRLADGVSGTRKFRSSTEKENLRRFPWPLKCVSSQSDGGVLESAFQLEESGEGSIRLSRDAILEMEARGVVLQVLREGGLSHDDADVVVSRAPVYIRELINCLNEVGGNDSLERGDDLNESSENTREKLYQLASHGRGLSPFLESLGVNLSSISKISFALAKQPLPELLSKVQYLEGILSKSEPRDRPLDGLIRFMFKNLSVSVWEDEDIQRTVSFFEKMKQKEGGLLGLEKSASLVPLLIEGFPQVFKRGLDHQIQPVVQFLDSLGVRGYSDLAKVILCYPSILLQDAEKDLLQRKRNLKAAGIRVQDMGRMLVRYPWLLSSCVASNVEALSQFLDSLKVSKKKVDRSITKYPHLLGCSTTSTLAPVAEHISTYGLTGRPLGKAISQSPELLMHSPKEFDSVVSYLRSVGVEEETISKLLRRSPEIMGSSIEGTLQRKVKVLEELGVRRSKVGRIIKFFPEILTMSVDSALLPRIKFLRNWGLSKHEISRMAFKFPPLLGYDVNNVLRPKLQHLTVTMGRSVKDVVLYPRYFSHSLEKKIKPRSKVLANRNIQCELKDMLAKSDDRFAAEFLGFESMWIPKTTTISKT